jgi:hypothetical protein
MSLFETKAQRQVEWKRLVAKHREALDQSQRHRKAGRHDIADGLLDACRDLQGQIDEHVLEDKQLAGV